MALSMFLKVNEYIMYVWSNKLYFSSGCKGEMLLSDSQISIRPLCLILLFTPLDAMFVTCLTKFLSWLVGVG